MRSIHPAFSYSRAALAGVLVLSAALLGCPKHEEFPTQLTLVVPPTPTSFVITYVGPNPQGGYDYDLSWAVNDPTTVDRYRVYLLDVGATPDLVAETTNTVLPATLPFLITGLRMAVAAVSTGNVEGQSRTATAP
jgi:hypothetical protein